MFKWRKLTTLLALCLVFVFITGARYSRYQPPQWIELIASDTFAFRVYNSSGSEVYSIGTSGEVVATGTATFNNTTTKGTTGALRRTPTNVSFVAGTGYTISAATGNVFNIPTSATDTSAGAGSGNVLSGVTVIIPAPSTALLGWEPTIVNISGTSPMRLYVDGTKTIGASGTTVVLTYDAEGDSVTLGYYETAQSGVSVYIKSDIVDGS